MAQNFEVGFNVFPQLSQNTLSLFDISSETKTLLTVLLISESENFLSFRVSNNVPIIRVIPPTTIASIK